MAEVKLWPPGGGGLCAIIVSLELYISLVKSLSLTSVIWLVISIMSFSWVFIWRQLFSQELVFFVLCWSRSIFKELISLWKTSQSLRLSSLPEEVVFSCSIVKKSTGAAIGASYNCFKQISPKSFQSVNALFWSSLHAIEIRTFQVLRNCLIQILTV